MTLATSASVHQMQHAIDDRKEEIRRHPERRRVSAWNVAALPMVYPRGIDDLTASPMKEADAKMPKSVAPRRWGWRLRLGMLHAVGVKR